MSSQRFYDQSTESNTTVNGDADDYYDPDEYYGADTARGPSTPDARASGTHTGARADAIELAVHEAREDAVPVAEAAAARVTIPLHSGDGVETAATAAPDTDAARATSASRVNARRGGVARARWLWIGVGVVVALVVISRLVTQTPAAGQTALDNTGSSRGQTSAGRGTTTPAPRHSTTPATTVVPGQIAASSLVSGPLILINPGIVRQGSSITVTGSGFEARALVDLTVRQTGSAQALTSTFAQADKNGAFSGASLTVPATLTAGNFTVNAQERNGSQTAHATGMVAGGAPAVKLGMQVGKPGDTLALTLTGFAAGETINVYWNSLSGKPVAALQANGAGGVGPTALQVPFGAVGNNTFLFVGARSQALVAADFLVLSLYPSVTLSSYALQADNAISFTGNGFGPSERVLVYLNNPNDVPITVLQSDHSGAFTNAGNVLIPFGVKGQETLIFVGEQSRAPDAVSFTILPYTPVAQPSAYGGFPGTTIAFYASAFARNEVVDVYAGHTKSSMGTLVSCFQTDAHGSAAAAGSYLIPGNAQAGSLGFALVGEQSGGVGLTSVNVSAPPTPVQTPPQQPFTCSLSQPRQAQTPAQATPGATPAAQGQPRHASEVASVSNVAFFRTTQPRPASGAVARGLMPALEAGSLALLALIALGVLLAVARSRRVVVLVARESRRQARTVRDPLMRQAEQRPRGIAWWLARVGRQALQAWHGSKEGLR